MIKKILLLTAIISFAITAKAQWFVGGNASVNIQNANIYANIAPEFGRRFVNGKLSVALRPLLRTTKQEVTTHNPHSEDVHTLHSTFTMDFTLWEDFK